MAVCCRCNLRGQMRTAHMGFKPTSTYVLELAGWEAAERSQWQRRRDKERQSQQMCPRPFPASRASTTFHHLPLHSAETIEMVLFNVGLRAQRCCPLFESSLSRLNCRRVGMSRPGQPPSQTVSPRPLGFRSHGRRIKRVRGLVAVGPETKARTPTHAQHTDIECRQTHASVASSSICRHMPKKPITSSLIYIMR